MGQQIVPMVFDPEQLEKEANGGDGLACYILGRSYDLEENRVEQSSEKALFWYRKGSELRDPRCIYGVGACYYFGDGVEQDKEKANTLFKEAYQSLLELIEKEQDSPERQAFSKFCLGAYYYFGLGDIQKNDEMAFSLIHESAMMGHIAGIYDLGANFYFNGVGVEKDLEKSKYYLELAASYGLPRAKTKLLDYDPIYASVSESKLAEESKPQI